MFDHSFNKLILFFSIPPALAYDFVMRQFVNWGNVIVCMYLPPLVFVFYCVFIFIFIYIFILFLLSRAEAIPNKMEKKKLVLKLIPRYKF